MFSKIKWNEVTWYSNVIAIVVFIGVFFLGMLVGQKYERSQLIKMTDVEKTEILGSAEDIIGASFFVCKSTPLFQKTIQAVFKRESVNITLNDKRIFELPQVISASGARYANQDESFVFWNKGNRAFVTERVGEKVTTTYVDCVEKK